MPPNWWWNGYNLPPIEVKKFKKQFEQSTADQIFMDILLPIEVFVGIALNVVVICI